MQVNSSSAEFNVKGVIDSLLDQELNLNDLFYVFERVKSKFKNEVQVNYKYDLQKSLGSGNHISNIYEILKDGIPRTTASWRNPSTGFKEESSLERELYKRFNCSPSVRAISARMSDIRKNTTCNPSIVFCVDDALVEGKKYKRRFYFMVEDGLGRSGEVPISQCLNWNLRRL